MAESRNGPASFALDADAPVGSATLPQLGAPQAQPGQIAPGLTVQAPSMSDGNARTFKAIADLSSDMLAPKIKEAQQEQFIGGVQRAMTGESLNEIIRDQPWYTDIFAPSSALAGARAYTSQQAIAQWAGQMQEAMPRLSRQGPEELQKAAVGSLQGFMTGDANADALITAGVVEQMAPLFKQHAKEHYIHVQKQASMAQIGSWESSAKVFQGFAQAEATGKGTVSKDDMQAAKSRLLASIAPFADQSDESFERNVGQFIEGAATGGNFQVIKLFKESGIYGKLNPDRRATLDRHLMSAGRVALDNAMPEFAMDVATLVNDMTQNPRDIPGKVQALNAKAAAYTGVTEASLIPLASLDNIMGGVMRAQLAEQNARMAKDGAARDKLQEKMNARAITLSQLRLGPGYLDRCLEAKTFCTEADAEVVGYSEYLQAKTPEDKAKVLNSRTKGGFGTVKTLFTESLRAPEYQGGVGQMAQVYQGLAEDVKTQYFGETERQTLDRFNAQVRSGVPPEAAWVSVRNGVGNALLTKDSKDEVSKLIRGHVESQNENFVGWNKVSDASLRTIEAMVSRTYKSDRTNNPPDVAVKRSYAQAVANGLDIQGQHAIVNARPSDPALYTVIGESKQGTGTAFDHVMETKAKALGASLDNYEVVRVPDSGGQARFYVNATGSDGQVVTWSITSGEVKAAVAEAVKKELPRKPGDPTGGAAFGIYPRP